MSDDRPAPSPARPDEQRRDAETSWPIHGTAVFTQSMVKGALIWTTIGLAVGAAVGAALALLPITSIPLATKLWIFAVCGGLAGATAGVLYGGGRQPEVDEEVGNQAKGAPLLEANRDPAEARRQIEETKRARRRSSASQDRRAG